MNWPLRRVSAVARVRLVPAAAPAATLAGVLCVALATIGLFASRPTGDDDARRHGAGGGKLRHHADAGRREDQRGGGPASGWPATALTPAVSAVRRAIAADSSATSAAACAPDALPQYSSRVNLVEVYVTVTDRDGRPVSGLTRADFALFEDDTPQTVSVFTAGEAGLSVAVALDRSFSMAGERLAGMKRAAERFLRDLRPTDRSMLIAIGSAVDVLAPLSEERRPQIDALLGLDAWGSTSLHDAVIAALDEIQAAPGRRALVLLSDGVDRYSRASAEDVLAHARRGDVQAYPIALTKARARPPLFVDLATATGGRSLQVDDPKKLDGALREIAQELRQQYLIGYEPRRDAGDGVEGVAEERAARAAGAEASPSTDAGQAVPPRWHRLRVQVNRKDVTVRARAGYWGR